MVDIQTFNMFSRGSWLTIIIPSIDSASSVLESGNSNIKSSMNPAKNWSVGVSL